MPRALRYWSSNMVDVFERLNNVGISWNVDYDTYVIYIEISIISNDNYGRFEYGMELCV